MTIGTFPSQYSTSSLPSAVRRSLHGKVAWFCCMRLTQKLRSAAVEALFCAHASRVTSAEASPHNEVRSLAYYSLYLCIRLCFIHMTLMQRIRGAHRT